MPKPMSLEARAADMDRQRVDMRVWYDTVVFRPDALEYLVNLAGTDKVMLGTDYPFDMAEADPVGLIEETNFSMAERAKICGGTIADLLGPV